MASWFMTSELVNHLRSRTRSMTSELVNHLRPRTMVHDL